MAVVDFLVESGLAKSREEAVYIGNELMGPGEYNLFEHVCKDHAFKDERLFYRFVDEDLNQIKASQPRDELAAGSRAKYCKLENEKKTTKDASTIKDLHQSCSSFFNVQPNEFCSTPQAEQYEMGKIRLMENKQKEFEDTIKKLRTDSSNINRLINNNKEQENNNEKHAKEVQQMKKKQQELEDTIKELRSEANLKDHMIYRLKKENKDLKRKQSNNNKNKQQQQQPTMIHNNDVPAASNNESINNDNDDNNTTKIANQEIENKKLNHAIRELLKRIHQEKTTNSEEEKKRDNNNGASFPNEILLKNNNHNHRQISSITCTIEEEKQQPIMNDEDDYNGFNNTKKNYEQYFKTVLKNKDRKQQEDHFTTTKNNDDGVVKFKWGDQNLVNDDPDDHQFEMNSRHRRKKTKALK